MAAPKKSTAKGWTVKKPFRDSEEYVSDGVINRYEVGVDVSHFDENRLAALESRGLVEKGNARADSEKEDE